MFGVADSTASGAATRVGASMDFRPHPLRRLLLCACTRLRRPWLDGTIARGVERPGDRALALREAQLVRPRERRRLALRFERILAQRARPVGPSSAVPVDHRAVEIAKPVLIELILALRSSGRVEARGVALGWRLLTDPCSPIYRQQGRSFDLDHLCHESLSVLFALQPLAGHDWAQACPADDGRPAASHAGDAPGASQA
jgi:hypothetical protein